MKNYCIVPIPHPAALFMRPWRQSTNHRHCSMLLKVATGLSSPVPIHQGEEGAATTVAVEGTWFNSETSSI